MIMALNQKFCPICTRVVNRVSSITYPYCTLRCLLAGSELTEAGINPEDWTNHLLEADRESLSPNTP